MNFREKVRIVAENEGIMTDTEIHAEYGIPPAQCKTIRAIIEKQRHKPKQLCWECAKA